MQQDARTAPDTDLEAYGDWVTVDATAPPSGRPPSATPDVEVAAELTEAEEEFLGRLSEADHGAAQAPGAGTRGVDAILPPGPAPASAPVIPEQVPERRPAPQHGAAGLASSEATVTPMAPVGMPVGAPMPVPPLAVPPPVAPAPAFHGADRNAPAEPAAAGAPELPAAPTAAAHAVDPSGSDMPSPPGRPEHLALLSAEPETAVPAAVLAALQERVAALEASVADVRDQVARLQAHGSGPASTETASGPGPGEVAVTLEELTDEKSPIAGDAGATAEPAAADAALDDGSGAPAIRLEPLPDSAAANPRDADPPAVVHDDAGVGTTAPDTFREEVRQVLACLDQLLDSLPPEKVREFAQSPDFATYRKLFSELGLDD